MSALLIAIVAVLVTFGAIGLFWWIATRKPSLALATTIAWLGCIAIGGAVAAARGNTVEDVFGVCLGVGAIVGLCIVKVGYLSGNLGR